MIDLPQAIPDAPLNRIVFDLDGILAENVYPETHVGDVITTGVMMLLQAYKRGYEVIIYTARPESHRTRIELWLREHGLEDYVNDIVTGKPIANIYIDDRGWNPTKEAGWTR